MDVDVEEKILYGRKKKLSRAEYMRQRLPKTYYRRWSVVPPKAAALKITEKRERVARADEKAGIEHRSKVSVAQEEKDMAFLTALEEQRDQEMWLEMTSEGGDCWADCWSDL